jgi:hypothetical protein
MTDEQIIEAATPDIAKRLMAAYGQETAALDPEMFAAFEQAAREVAADVLAIMRPLVARAG